jgi:uncharacterized membrane protein YgcG
MFINRPVNRTAGIAAGCALACGLVAHASQDTIGTQAAKSKVHKGEPCCNVVSTDAATNTVTAKATATGATFKFEVPASLLASFKANDVLRLDLAEPAGAAASGATASGASAGGTTSGGGSSSGGSNVGRNVDTRPKDCIATNSAGQQVKVACPSNVVIKATK